MAHSLITGGAGFIGSHLTELLLRRGDRVTVVDDCSTGQLTNLSKVANHPNFQFIRSDLSQPDLIEQLCHEVDRVFHLAAAVGVALIAKHPIQTIERNIYPTQLLLTSLRKQYEAGRTVPFFLASTSEVYGKNPKPVWNEQDDLVFGATTKPRWSYGASKAIDEFLALASHRETSLPIVIGRFFNVVGPRQTGAYGMVLPRFVEAARQRRPLIVHDDGSQIRCFAHVADVTQAVVKLIETPEALGKVFNIGSDTPVTILKLAETVRQIVNPDAEIRFQSYSEAYDDDFEDIRRRVPDLGRIRQTIGFSPTYDLPQIVRDVYESQISVQNT